MTMTDHAKLYVASKKALGLSFREQERVLMRYAEHVDARGDEFVRINSVLDWVRYGRHRLVGRKNRLSIVRGLAVFLHVGDHRHEVPHRDALGKRRQYRPPPCIPSPEEIRRIMTEALSLGPTGSLTPRTFHTIIGLIACTGLRRSEATGLLLGDLGPDGLLVRNTKNRRDRLVPLHESTRRALDDYLVARKRQGGPCEHLFVLASRTAGAPGLSDCDLHPARSQGRGSRQSRGTRPQASRPEARIRRRRTARLHLFQPEGCRPAHARALDLSSDTRELWIRTGTSRRHPSSCVRCRWRPRNCS